MVRAVACKQTLKTLRALGEATQIFARVPADVIAEIEDAPSLGWIALDRQLHVVTAARSVLGRTRYQMVCEEHTRLLADSPVLASYCAATLRLLGVDREKLSRFAVRVWSTLYRNCGELSCGPGRRDDQTVFRLTNHPPDSLEVRCDVLAGAFACIPGFVGQAGEVRITACDTERGTAELTLTWKTHR